MAKRKTVTIEHSKEDIVNAFLSRCFENGTAMGISPMFDHEYVINEKTYLFSEEILDQILETGRVKVTYRSDKLVCIEGIKTD